MSIKKCHNVARIRWLRRRGAECGLHPLIHTFPLESSAQNVEKKKGGAKDSAVFFEK
jgi:hypothetical protein